MNISISRIQAIFMKDYKEFSRNYAVSIMVLMPLLMAFINNKTGADNLQAYFLPINMTFAVVTAFVQCCLIAEEKEKNTLRSLMLSPASLADILIGKSLFAFILSAIIVGLTISFVGYKPANLFVLGIAICITIIFYIALGTLCGLFTKTIMEASVAILPVMAIFTFGPFALLFSKQYPILTIAEWLPSAQLLLLAEALESSYSPMDIIIPLVAITVWAIVTWFLTAAMCKKRMVD